MYTVEDISDGLRQDCFIFIHYYKQCLNAMGNNANIFIVAQNSILIGHKYLKKLFIKIKIKYDEKIYKSPNLFVAEPHMTPGKGNGWKELKKFAIKTSIFQNPRKKNRFIC